MKRLFLFIIFISLVTTLQTRAQEITATLSGSTSSEGFSVKDNGGTTLFRVRGDGNVGIGIAGPTGKLTLGSGQILVPDGTSGAPTYSFSGTTTTGMFRTSGAVKFSALGTGVLELWNFQIKPLIGIHSSPSGSASDPQYSWSGDQNTGMYSGGADILGFSTGGTERLLINASGNIGISTTSPTAKIDVNGSTGYDQLRMRTNYTPIGTSDTNGNTGDIAWDDNFIYIKTSAGWKRASLSTF